MTNSSNTPLNGLKIIEIEGLGPGPFAAMFLGDLGANVLRIRRPSKYPPKGNPVLDRNRAGTLVLNMKDDKDFSKLQKLIDESDVLIEGFRPDVMERLGIGPDECLQRNAKLIYGRITGWGRSGPLAKTAGHDINYIGITGALNAIGTKDSGPIPPLNLAGDYGGGGLMLVMGILAALHESKTSGLGQVVDTDMLGGAASLMGALFGRQYHGLWSDNRAENIVDGSAYFYRCYECKDNRWMSAGPIEIPFRTEFLTILGFNEDEISDILKQQDNSEEVIEKIGSIFKSQSSEHWCDKFDNTEACVFPVLTMTEAKSHPQNIAMGTFSEINGATHPMPTPHFSRTELLTPNTQDKNKSMLDQWANL